MTVNDIIEKCACILDADREECLDRARAHDDKDRRAQWAACANTNLLNARAIRALKSSPDMKGDDANDRCSRETGEIRTSDASPRLNAGAIKSSLSAEIVSAVMVEDLTQTALETFDNVYAAEFRVTGITDNKPVAMRAAVESVIAAFTKADDGWRPIENGAPKDGTGILVWIRGAKLPFTARWSVARNRWVDMQNDESVYPSPTHWRPLPAPPKDGRE